MNAQHSKHLGPSHHLTSGLLLFALLLIAAGTKLIFYAPTDSTPLSTSAKAEAPARIEPNPDYGLTAGIGNDKASAAAWQGAPNPDYGRTAGIGGGTAKAGRLATRQISSNPDYGLTAGQSGSQKKHTAIEPQADYGLIR